MKAKLSGFYSTRLSVAQADLARKIIRATRPLEDIAGGKRVYETFNKRVRVLPGFSQVVLDAGTPGSRSYRVRAISSQAYASPGELICQAVLDGYITAEHKFKLVDSIDGDKTTATKPDVPDAVASILEAADKSVPKPKPKPLNPDEYLEQKFTEIEQYLASGQAEQDDVVSTATWKYAGRMLGVGIPPEAILDAYAKNWPQTARNKLDIPHFDPRTYGEPIEGQHKVVPYIMALLKANVPVMLVGPTQSGKGYASRNVAENLGVPFGAVPLMAGASISWLFGRNMPQSYVGTPFVELYDKANVGGVFLADEMDAADSNMLIGINDAISNNELHNPIINKVIEKHENFHILAAANTWGTGANAQYSGRERLDMATLERFRMGRVMVEYDRDLQRKVFRQELESYAR